MDEKLLPDEERYRSFFDNMLNGSAHCRMLFDKNRPVDFIFLRVNKAFGSLTGLKHVVGKRVSEVIPGIRESDPELFERFGSVALTGISERFEILVKALRMWFSVSVYSPQKEDFVVLFDVITERKKTEESLRKSEQRYRLLFNSISDAVFVHGYNADGTPGRFVEVNDVACQRLGYTRDELLRMSPADIDTPETFALIPGILGGLRKNGHAVWEGFHVTKDGRRIPVEISNRLLDLAGKPAALATVRDITERKQSELALAEESARRRLLFEQSRDGIVVLDENGKVFEANPKYAEMLGYTLEEVNDLYVWDWDAQWTRKELEEKVQTVDVSGDFFETRHLRKDGTIFDVEISTTGAVFAGQKLVFCICRDISQRKAAENALRESDAFIKAVMENLPIGIAVNSVLPSVEFVYMNDNFPRFYRTTRDALATPDAFWHAVYEAPKFREKIRRRVLEDCASGDPERMHWEEIPITREGEETSYVTARNILVPNKQLMISTVWDVTEFKVAEEERKRLEERLQRAEKMEAIGTMAGGIAHDLNNVLGIVVGYSELLVDDLQKSSPERFQAMEILKGGQRASAIVQDLLTLARRGVPTREVLNLNDIIRDCHNSAECKMLRSSYPNIQIEIDLEPNLLNIAGSPVHLGKSLMNLVSNAAEAMTEGGVIAVKTRNQYLDQPVMGYDEVKEGDYVVFSVSDTGEGIPPSDLKRIFEPFYTKKIMGRSGTGLGLAVVWGTVKDHLGYINVESEEGTGTTFTLYFPVTREEMPAELISESASQYMGHGESILVVDDVKEQRDLATAMLEKLNYRVISVSSGERAVEYVKQHKFDLLVLDMIMDPGMDGLDTYTKILEIHPKQKAVIVSGFAETERISKALSLGAGAYVKKPYLLGKLGSAVSNELRRKE